jgi:hypothetical protein
MKPPPFLIGAALILWGWHTNLLPFALLMVPVIEGARYTKSRWMLSLSDFSRISDICTLILLGIAVYVLFTHPRAIIMLTVKWLPVITFPLLAAQEYSTSEKIDIRAFLMLTRKMTLNPDYPVVAINFSYPYFVLCLIAAASANNRTYNFYVCLILLAIWALLKYRSKRYHLVLWFFLVLMAGAAGYIGHIGLNQLQGTLMNWTSDFFLSDSNPNYSSTAIGKIGEVKHSNRIVYRVEVKGKIPKKILMREASYNQYFFSSSKWFAGNSPMIKLDPEKEGNTWKLGSKGNNNATLTVTSFLQQGKGILKLPLGASKIDGPSGLKIKKNDLGAIMVEEGPGLIRYDVQYNPSFGADRPPNHQDLYVPFMERSGISTFMDQMKLSGKPPEQVLLTLKTLFQEKFTYTLDLKVNQAKRPAITHFLLSSRSGHCEYFATATALILRASGIPTRYAKGFLAHEFSKIENKIVVRSRHAHAWVLVHIKGKWYNLDTTPSAWISIEEENISGLSLISDVFSYVLFKFSEWRWNEETKAWEKFSLVLLIPLVIILLRRIYSKKKIQRVLRSPGQKTRAEICFEKKSVFFQIEKQLNALGFKRHSWETLQHWIVRIENTAPAIVSHTRLLPTLSLHYRSRFGHHGLNSQEKKELDKNVNAVLDTLKN